MLELIARYYVASKENCKFDTGSFFCEILVNLTLLYSVSLTIP